MLVGHRDVVHVDRLAHQGAGFGIGLRRFEEVGAHPGAEVLGFADVDHLALGVLVEVAAGRSGQGADFCQQIHGPLFEFSLHRPV